MKIVARKAGSIPACSAKSKEMFAKACARLKQLPQIDVKTQHHLHAGVYSRTVFIPKGSLVIGCVIRCPTQVIFSGSGCLANGDASKDIHGYVVMEGLPDRQCAVFAYEDTWVTMLFATKAKTVAEAEKEFCDDPDQLLSNWEKRLCQECGQRLA